MKQQRDETLCQYEGIVEYDHSHTWPPTLPSLFEREFACLEAYELRRAEIDEICRKDVMARIHGLPNEHKQSRDEVLREANTILANYPLLGFHCTRLTQTEIKAIRASGLIPLNMELVQQRMEQAVSEGQITVNQRDQLLSANEVEDLGRKGMTHFINRRSILMSEPDVFPLFRSWAGEAVYNSHEYQSETASLLRSVGKPAIVITAIPISKLRTSLGTGNQFLCKFLSDRSVSTGDAPELETHTIEPVPASMILDVIEFEDSRFERLTEYSTWSESIA